MNNLRFLAACLLLTTLAHGAAAVPKDPQNSKWVNEPPQPLPAGITHKTYHSACMGHDVGYCIYLPPQYEQAPDQRFPVIYELHGNGGTEISSIPVAQELDADIKAGKCPPYIMVMPNGGLATQYNDSADKKIMPDTTIIKELIPYIDAHYRTMASREGRAVEGFSMGSCGATKFAFEHPELFGSLIAWAGSMPHLADRLKELDHPTPGQLSPVEYLGKDPATYRDNDIYLLLRKNADQIRGKMVIEIVCGTADWFHLPGTRDLHNVLLQLGIDHTYCEVAAVAHQRTQLRAVFGDRAFEPHVQGLQGKFPKGIASANPSRPGKVTLRIPSEFQIYEANNPRA